MPQPLIERIGAVYVKKGPANSTQYELVFYPIGGGSAILFGQDSRMAFPSKEAVVGYLAAMLMLHSNVRWTRERAGELRLLRLDVALKPERLPANEVTVEILPADGDPAKLLKILSDLIDNPMALKAA
jgi:hypothetical protein